MTGGLGAGPRSFGRRILGSVCGYQDLILEEGSHTLRGGMAGGEPERGPLKSGDSVKGSLAGDEVPGHRAPRWTVFGSTVHSSALGYCAGLF